MRKNQNSKVLDVNYVTVVTAVQVLIFILCLNGFVQQHKIFKITQKVVILAYKSNSNNIGSSL